MKLLSLLLATLVIVTSCASSSNKSKDDEQDKFPNLVSLTKPGEQPNEPATVYIDSVKNITVQNKAALLISGTFPDACTKLRKATHSVENNRLALELKGWRNPEEMCAQVLTPFNYIYQELAEDEISNHSAILINGTEYRY